MEMERLLTDLGVRRLRICGTNIQACCPNSCHAENRPSWGIMIHYPYSHHCFVCSNYSGSVVTLIMDIKKCNPMEAFKIAEEYGYKESDKKGTEVSKSILTEMELDKYTSFYNKELIRRGLSVDTLKEWEVGYDLEKERHIFTIRDENKKLVGVGARAAKETHARYGFYSGTKKGSAIYGLYKCKKDLKYLIVVEGFMDVLKLWELKFKNVVGLMGNQATERQRELLIKYANVIYLALDNDIEGRQGTNKLIRQLKGKIKLYLLEYPGRIKDAGEFKRKSQVKRWLRGRKIVLV